MGMKLSRERKVYVGVLAAAGAIWGADRVFFGGGPQDAAASVVQGQAHKASTEKRPPPQQAAVTQLPGAAGAAVVTSLAERLARLDGAAQQGADGGGVFAEPEWLKAKPSRTAAITKVEAKKSFAETHTVTAVSKPREGVASVIVKGKIVHLNTDLDGHRLTQITPTEAVFVSEEGEARLPLPGVNSRDNGKTDVTAGG